MEFLPRANSHADGVKILWTNFELASPALRKCGNTCFFQCRGSVNKMDQRLSWQVAHGMGGPWGTLRGGLNACMARWANLKKGGWQLHKT